MIAQSTFLRRVMAFDTVTCLGAGALLAFGGATLENVTGLPTAISQPAGVFLFAWAALVAAIGLRQNVNGGLVWLVIVGNAIWTLESLMMLALGWVEPTQIGVAFVVAQALGVAGIAQLQYMGLRRSTRFA